MLDGVSARRLLEGREAEAQAEFARELELARGGGAMRGEVFLIGAGPGDPDLLTLKALQLLQQADVIVYDRLVAPAVLERARRDARRIDAGKAPGGPHPTQAFINAQLVSLARQGLKVARLKGGDPFISVAAARKSPRSPPPAFRSPWSPAITAALGAAASAGVPLTYRGVSRSVTLVTAHSAGDETLAGGMPWRVTARRSFSTWAWRSLRAWSRTSRAPGRRARGRSQSLSARRHPEQRVLHSTLATVVAQAAKWADRRTGAAHRR